MEGSNQIALLEEKIEDFGFPVTLAFSTNRKVFVSERISGRLWQIDHGTYRLVKSFSVVPFLGHHETGLLGIALDPDFEKNGYIYCYYTEGKDTQHMRNKVVKIKENGQDEEVILDNIPAGRIHNGGILLFGQDGCLYIGVGVQNEIKEKAQDISWLGGKVLRVNRDGSIPADNPFPHSPVYSYGHRNIFGLAVHPKTGKIYASDVGPNDNDEIDIIQKGGNYGWPQVMGPSDKKEFINPIQTYPHVITPVQMVVVSNDLYVGSYNEGSVHKLTLSGEDFDKVVKDEIVYKGKPWDLIGVFYGTDNEFYITTSSSIQRITIS